MSRRTALTAALVVAGTRIAPAQAPILPDGSSLRPGQFAWQPEVAPDGPVLVLVSLTEQQARVYRNGIEIGTAAATFARPEEPLRPGVFVLLDRRDAAARPIWTAVALANRAGPSIVSDALDRLTLPPAFAAAVQPMLVPGTSLYCALASADATTRTDPGFTVLSALPS